MADEMNPSYGAVRPPRWAEAVLAMFLGPEEAETVSGDLLETYRDSIYPGRGRVRADVWFVRQVAGFVLRASAGWGVLFALIWVVGPFRMLLAGQTDWFAAGLEQKAIAAMVFVLAGRRAWRSRSIRAGLILALGIAAVGSLIWIGGAIVQAARWNPAMSPVQSLRQHLDRSVFIMIPALSLIMAGLVGTAGAIGGKFLRSATHTLAK